MNSLEEMSISGLGQRMFGVFGLTHQPIECPTNDRLWMADRQARAQGKKAELPILAYSLSNIGPPATGANATAWMSRGIRTTAVDDVIGSMRVLPVEMTFGVTYLDTDRVRLMRFMAAWLLARAQGTLNFRLRADGIPIDVQVKPEDSLSAPQKDISVDNPNLYEFTGNIVMSTYVSGDFKVAIKRLTRVSEIATTLQNPAAMPDTLPTGSTPTDVIDRAEAVEQFGDVIGENLIYSFTTHLLGDDDGR